MTIDPAASALTGAIVAYIGKRDLLPSNWKVCDGTPYDVGLYADLFAILGTPTVPDLQGYFLRGQDPTGNVDPDGKTRALGSVQPDDFRSHTHAQQYTDYGDFTQIAEGGTWQRYEGGTGPAGGDETRPKNVCVLYVINLGPESHPGA